MNRPNCRKCKKPMEHGEALVSTTQGNVTVSFGGSGRLVPVWKCPCCGYSVTR